MSTLSTTGHSDRPYPSHYQVNTPKGMYNIPMDDIFFVECHQKKSFIHAKAGIFVLQVPLYRLKEALPSVLFLQTHRSFLVNLKNISHINKRTDPWTVSFFDTNEQAFISRSFRQKVMATVSD